MSEQSCSSCRFCLIREEQVDLCRRNPPQVVAYTYSQTMGERGDYREEVDTNITTRWPEVETDDWCGEWQAREEKKDE